MKQTRKDDKDRVGCLERGTLATLRWKLSTAVTDHSHSSSVTSQQVSEAAITGLCRLHFITFPEFK